MQYGGAFASQNILELISGGFLGGVILDNSIRPGSIDPSITTEGYRVHGAFLPSHNETVEEALKSVGAIALREGSILERGTCYVFRLSISIKSLPKKIYAYCNPKSSSGRVDVHVRLLVDKVSRYDYIPENYTGPLWLMIVPKTFSVIIPMGISLNQIRFFNQDTRLDELRLEQASASNGGMIFTSDGEKVDYRNFIHTDNDGSILLTLGLDYPIPGFQAIKTGEPINLGLLNHYDPRHFFRPVQLTDKKLVLADNEFYILSSREYVRVPENFACEMRPMDERSGDLRSHYAGFIDPGWGVGPEGHGCGRPLTLEVRSFDNGLIVAHGQPIAKIHFERMIEIPLFHYDQVNSTYGEQFGPKLGKCFKVWEE